MYSIIIALTGLGVSAAEAFALAALHPTRDNNYLTTLANGIVAGLPYGRTVADMAALADPAYNLSAADVVTLLSASPIGLPAAFSTTHIVSLVGYIAGLNAHQMVQLVNCLHPSLSVTRTLGLLAALRADGLDGLQTHSLIQRLNAAGQTGQQIEALIRRLRGNLQNVAPPHPAAIDVTTPLGEKVLSGVEIAAHLTHTLAAGRAATTIIDSYPTGQDFTLRTDDQLWTDCTIAITYADINTLANETPDQKQIRQKLALGELIARHPGRGQLIQRIFAHDEGQTARGFVSVVDEDTYSGGHIVDRHVMNGTGTIPDTPVQRSRILAVARRVCTKVPPCGVKAGAFNSVAEANSVLGPAIAASMAANWFYYRDLIIRLGAIPRISLPSTAGLGVCLRKTDHPRMTRYPTGHTGWGRPLIGPAVGPLATRGLTHHLPVTKVEIRITTSNHKNAHGWAVITAWPL